MAQHDSERMKILEMLESGKINADEAHRLLQAIDQKSVRTFTLPPLSTHIDKATQEWKQWGSQLKTILADSMTDLRRNIEQQGEEWLFWQNTVKAVHELHLPPSIKDLSFSLQNGEVHVEGWSEPYSRVYIHATMRQATQEDAKTYLAECLENTQTESSSRLRLANTRDKNLLLRAHIDIFVPKNVEMHLRIHSHNGAIDALNTDVKTMHVETLNGAIILQGVNAEQIRLESFNGRIQLFDSIHSKTEHLTANTKNGKIEISGIHHQGQVSGTLRTSVGSIQLDENEFTAERELGAFKNSVRFQRLVSDTSSHTEIFCRTNNGSIALSSISNPGRK
ncbi:SHOCT-like domain-containing protein [Alicyclobacillus tolerans]|uniref:DUF4097 and DUF4098 domain-containing protein YvlB n=1 Tax=Alicyclobacillus tolerans TaxID=90970 RepID=A0ABT9LSS0_9BACL|nr:DUF4097 family beta strand repeat-containing protein [Alicyclobacillus tengchongensis]MDP9727316.1 DUF4097 and DUF4098 domain-containing protein YvlB [Alicyclobacillus tengchongensis]